MSIYKPTLKEVLLEIKSYLKTNKDLSQLLTGEGSFINCFNKQTHRIHGKVDTLGTNTGRFSHYSPNVSQLSKDREFRELITVPKGKLLVSVDANALELVMMGHYLGKYDNYKFAQTVDSGDKSKGTDIHSVNQRLAGLDTRDQAKTLIYGVLYGAGSTKVGLSLANPNTKVTYTQSEFNSERERLLNKTIKIHNELYYPISKGSVAPFNDELIIKSIYGGQILDKFKNNTVGYHELNSELTLLADNKELYGLDGRKLYSRASYKALNLMLQSAGAIFMKHLLVFIDSKLKKLWTCGKEFAYVLNIHDDIELEIIPEIKDELCKILKSSFIETSYNLGLKYPVYGEPEVGKNQWEVH